MIADWIRCQIREGLQVAINFDVVITPEMQAYLKGFGDGAQAVAEAVMERLEQIANGESRDDDAEELEEG